MRKTCALQPFYLGVSTVKKSTNAFENILSDTYSIQNTFLALTFSTRVTMKEQR